MTKANTKTREEIYHNIHGTRDQHADGTAKLGFDQFQLVVGNRRTSQGCPIAIHHAVTALLENGSVVASKGLDATDGTAQLIAEVALAGLIDEQLIEVDHHAGQQTAEN